MPHLVVETTRYAIERRIHGLPMVTDAPGDILAPPFPLRRTLTTPLGIVRVQLIVRTVVLQPVTGSTRATLALTFDEGSVEFLSTGQAESLLRGSSAIPFALRFEVAIVWNPKTNQNRLIAQLMVDFSGAAVVFAFEAESKARLVAKIGSLAADLVEAAIASSLSALFGGRPPSPTGIAFNLTPGVPSEDLLTVDALPGVVWLNAETLALSLRYAAEPVPPPFQPVPFLPSGQPRAFGLRLSNEGFQRSLRNPAVRRIARDMLSTRLIDGFVRDVWVKDGGTGPITAEHRKQGKAALDLYLSTPGGRAELAVETPAPVGTGQLRKRISPAPDPFSDFDVLVPELDLWLGDGRIEGRARATGEVNGFGFTANVRFRARPVLVQQPLGLGIEMHDIEIDTPDFQVNLPPWLEWASSALVSVIAGPIAGVIAGFVLSSIVASLVEALLPSDLGSYVPEPELPPVGRLPAGVSVDGMTIVPESLTILGAWNVAIEDPRPFYPRVAIVDRMDRTQVAEREGAAWFSCLGDLGFVADSDPQWGTSFPYVHRSFRSRVIAEVESTAVPLPLTRFPWTIAVGYRSMTQYHPPHITTARQPLVPGEMTFTTDVWYPEPALGGHVASATFSIGVQRSVDDRYTLDVPTNAGCILIELTTKVVDAAGATWQLSTIIDVPNETVTPGPEFEEFTRECESGRREFQWLGEPSRLDTVWNPPDVFATKVQRAIRIEQPAVTTAIATLLEARGTAALDVILAPSSIQRG